MSAIQGRSPKERDGLDKVDALRSPKAAESPEPTRRDSDRKEREAKEKDKKERTKALGTLDLACDAASLVSLRGPILTM